MSEKEFILKNEEEDTGAESQEIVENFIENKAIISFLIQHEPRKDIDLSKIKIPTYLDLNDEEEDN